MTDQIDEHLEDERADELSEPGAIGVGMGGSCPSCRAPVDLGQEFCLECGAPIRFTPRQRRRQRAARQPATAPAAAASPPPRAKVPWIPILVVLTLIGGGIAFALTDGDGAKDDSGATATTEEALPEITNSVPETSSTTSTVTLQDCDPAQPLSGTEPTIPGGVSPSVDSLDGGSEQIPELSEQPGGGAAGGFDQDPFADDPAAAAPPSTTPESGGATVTVDQSGNLCSDGDSGALGGEDDLLDPTDPAVSTDGGSSSNTSTSSGEWPSGRNGWTVIVFGYPTKERATQSALDLQQDGFTDGGVLFSSDFKSLCPGFHVVYSGIFSSEGDAKKRLTELEREGYVKMYPREIRNDGPAPDCATTS